MTVVKADRLALGGHQFASIAAPATVPLWRCIRCHGVVPGWALADAMWVYALIGRRCRELHRAIGAAA